MDLWKDLNIDLTRMQQRKRLPEAMKEDTTEDSKGLEDGIDQTYREGSAGEGEGPYSRGMREMVWFLRNKAQWPERRIKEAKKKVRQKRLQELLQKTWWQAPARGWRPSVQGRRSCQGGAPLDLPRRRQVEVKHKEHDDDEQDKHKAPRNIVLEGGSPA